MTLQPTYTDDDYHEYNTDTEDGSGVCIHSTSTDITLVAVNPPGWAPGDIFVHLEPTEAAQVAEALTVAVQRTLRRPLCKGEVMRDGSEQASLFKPLFEGEPPF
jgi:hypothetical protein